MIWNTKHNTGETGFHKPNRYTQLDHKSIKIIAISFKPHRFSILNGSVEQEGTSKAEHSDFRAVLNRLCSGSHASKSALLNALFTKFEHRVRFETYKNLECCLTWIKINSSCVIKCEIVFGINIVFEIRWKFNKLWNIGVVHLDWCQYCY